jgi:protein tyrosine/serine phosphatase
MEHVNLKWELMKLCSRNRDGSFATQAARRDILTLCAEQLAAAGFYNLAPKSLKPKHVEALISKWQEESKSTGTIKNRVAHLRWWAEKIGKPNIIAKDNSAYGIPKRKYVTNESKAIDLDKNKLDKIRDEWIKCSLELQRAFGLRREESIKFQPKYADLGDRIRLKASWTKGGKAREILIRNDYQKKALIKAHEIAQNGSLIPANKKYVQQKRLFERLCKDVGFSKTHGFRHAYAQERYKELTGRDCPACGGKISKELTTEEKAQDLKARLEISHELGHNREEISSVYLGR